MTDTAANNLEELVSPPLETNLDIERRGSEISLTFTGSWTIADIGSWDDPMLEIADEGAKKIVVDTSNAEPFDTSAAWLVRRLQESVEADGAAFTHIDDGGKHTTLVESVQHNEVEHEPEQLQHGYVSGFFSGLGRWTIEFWRDFITACFLVGSSIRGSQMKTFRRRGLRLKSIINQMDHMGLRAVPVVAVMSFLIGAIIAQQGAYQLRFFGEELLVIDLVGILHFREIAVLLTAVMVAGRSGSAITAELGTMKMREEVDALRVIGLNPVGVLIFPRLIALIIVLPILTLLSDITGMAGAIFISDLYVGIPPLQFLSVLQENIPPQHIIVGLIKAPFMAVIIGLLAAVEGLKVGGSSESLGQRTTSSVVRAIFAVIVVDGVFAIFFAAVGY